MYLVGLSAQARGLVLSLGLVFRLLYLLGILCTQSEKLPKYMYVKALDLLILSTTV